jgi:hypothetical protein
MLSEPIGRMSVVDWWGSVMANGVESNGGWVRIEEGAEKRQMCSRQ